MTGQGHFAGMEDTATLHIVLDELGITPEQIAPEHRWYVAGRQPKWYQGDKHPGDELEPPAWYVAECEAHRAPITAEKDAQVAAGKVPTKTLTRGEYGTIGDVGRTACPVRAARDFNRYRYLRNPDGFLS